MPFINHLRVLLVVKDNVSSILFEYDSQFIKELSSHKDYNLAWNKVKNQWQFTTTHLDDIITLLEKYKIDFLLDDRRKISAIKPAVLMVIQKDHSSIMFEFFSPLVSEIKKNKEKLNLFWNAEKKKWRFPTAEIDAVKDLVKNQNILIIIDDRRV